MLEKGLAGALREPLEFLAKIDLRKKVILLKKSPAIKFVFYIA